MQALAECSVHPTPGEWGVGGSEGNPDFVHLKWPSGFWLYSKFHFPGITVLFGCVGGGGRHSDPQIPEGMTGAVVILRGRCSPWAPEEAQNLQCTSPLGLVARWLDTQVYRTPRTRIHHKPPTSSSTAKGVSPSAARETPTVCPHGSSDCRCCFELLSSPGGMCGVEHMCGISH